MKIKKLEICGFKSFVDRTVINFDHDVTGIVGPNGCGKSNIVDAIKWVMGEQSAQRLRGKGMEDVIFNGSESRPPHGFAEVAMTFDNREGLAPPEYKDYAEICVRRRIDREGRSDYFINKTNVRLLDVTNLFLGTGVGKRAYSIIEQGRIGLIVSSKPEDRRQIIEEAAGITKFKARKKAAERKMDQTRDNLTRVHDIVREIERNLDSLKRQAAKAERYKSYRAELRDGEMHVMAHRFLALQVQHRYMLGAHAEASRAFEASRLALAHADAEVEVHRQRVAETEEEVRLAAAEAHRVDRLVTELEGVQNAQRQMLVSARAQIARARLDEVEAAAQIDRLVSERDEAKATFAGLEETRAMWRQRRAEADTEELEARREASVATRAQQSARAQAQEVATRCARAEVALNSFETRRNERMARLEELLAEEGRLGEDRAASEQALTEAREARDACVAREASLRTEELAALAALAEAKEALKLGDRALEGAREEVTAARSKLQSLRELRARCEGASGGVHVLMNAYAKTQEARASRGVLGLLADHLDCPPAWSVALASALDGALERVLVRDFSDATSALAYLREHKGGRASLWWPSAAHASAAEQEQVTGESDARAQQGGDASNASMQRPHVAQRQAALRAHPKVLGCMADWVGVSVLDAPAHEAVPDSNQALAGLSEALSGLLQRFWLVESLDDAGEVFSAGCLSEQDALVTRDGDVLTGQGVVSGGGEAEASGRHFLEMRKQLEALEGGLAEKDARLSERIEAQQCQRDALAQAQKSVDHLCGEKHAVALQRVESQGVLTKLEERIKEGTRRTQRHAQALEEQQLRLRQLEEEEEAARQGLEELAALQREVEEEHVRADEAAARAQEVLGEAARTHSEVRVRAAQVEQEAQSIGGALERLTRSTDELATRLTRARGEIEAGIAAFVDAMAKLWQSRVTLCASLVEAGEAHERREAAQGQHEAARHVLVEQEQGLKSGRALHASATQEVNRLEMALQESSLSQTHLEEHAQSKHRVHLPDVLLAHHAKPVPDAALHQRIEELQRLIERMGEINLMAIEEYEEKSTRHAFLTTQQRDLEDALRQLEKAVEQMNRESRKRFREAYHEINARFQSVFPKMFGGGKAELRLTEPDNMLGTGIDIVAQPPGKKLGSLELMSGGEKALTAVSLIFAIFQYKPSPFCLLDEVDAPLDEANIGRFSDAVRDMTAHSQFIIITHSKRTMETADVLCGITMEQPGVSKLVSVELTRHVRAVA